VKYSQPFVKYSHFIPARVESPGFYQFDTRNTFPDTAACNKKVVEEATQKTGIGKIWSLSGS
jgi:hypothetical protein